MKLSTLATIVTRVFGLWQLLESVTAVSLAIPFLFPLLSAGEGWGTDVWFHFAPVALNLVWGFLAFYFAPLVGRLVAGKGDADVDFGALTAVDLLACGLLVIGSLFFLRNLPMAALKTLDLIRERQGQRVPGDESISVNFLCYCISGFVVALLCRVIARRLPGNRSE